MSKREPRLNGRQITTIVIAVCIAVVAFPVGVFAASTASSVFVSDPTHPSLKAHVAGGKLLVGDGSGALTVNGAVSVTGTAATRSTDKTVALFSGALVSGNSSKTVSIAAYSNVRVSATNTDGTTCALIVLSSVDNQQQSGITSVLYDGTVSANGHLSLDYDTPGLYLSVTALCNDDVEIFGRP